MEFIQLIRKDSDILEPKRLFLFGISGTLNFLIIASILVSLRQDSESYGLHIGMFVISVVLYIFVQKYSLIQSNRIAEKMVTQIRMRLVDQVRRMDLLSFEKLGEHRIRNFLNQEAMDISEATRFFARLCSSSMVLVVASIYMMFISVPAFLVSGGLMYGGIQLYRKHRDAIESDLIAAAWQVIRFFELVKHMLDGFKEIKLNQAKSNDLFENYLVANAKKAEKLKLSAGIKLNRMIIFATLFSYVILAVMVFIFPEYVAIDSFSLYQIAALVLFVAAGPLQEVVGAFPVLERANTAVLRLYQLEDEMKKMTYEKVPSSPSILKISPFQFLSCESLIFHYTGEEAKSAFQIGPLDFRLNRGEVVFIMGGNGAGKSTLLKVLTALYPPTQGQIVWNDIRVRPSNAYLYRSNFSLILQDMHLFDRLYGVQSIDREVVEDLLIRMELEDKTDVLEDGAFRSIELSMGQKKRLALIAAELEQRDVLIFDEWAADQDPRFRKYFYEVYLPHLKKRGKTVLAVTHDDRYYATADRLLKMEYGALLDVTNQKEAHR